MSTKVEICERAALDDVVLPILHEQQRYVGMVHQCECGGTHLAGEQRVHMVRWMASAIRNRDTKIRALESMIQQMAEDKKAL